jgi:phosphonoacetate hydrolase
MFGDLDVLGEDLTGYRAHGSLYESRVPLVIHGADRAPAAEWFRVNLDLARWVFPFGGTTDGRVRAVP